MVLKYLGAFITVNWFDGSKGEASTKPGQFMETSRLRLIKGKTFSFLSQTWSKGEIWQLKMGWSLCLRTPLGFLWGFWVLDNSWNILSSSHRYYKNFPLGHFIPHRDISLALKRSSFQRDWVSRQIRFSVREIKLYSTFYSFLAIFYINMVIFYTLFLTLANDSLVSSSTVKPLVTDVWLGSNSKPN